MEGAQVALSATGPQDQFVWGLSDSWIPKMSTHTPFVTSQRFFNLVSLSGFLGQIVKVDLKPKDLPDLLSNMHLKFTIPVNDSLGNPIVYSPMLGRAIINSVSFMIDGNIVEQITDDWYSIRDDIFLTADQQLAMYSVVGPSTSTSVGGDYIVPLDFFFCQRKGSNNPYFPLCATSNSVITVSFEFNNMEWITNTTSTIDMSNVMLIVEGVTLSDEERLYYQTNPMQFDIPTASREAQLDYVNGVAVMHLSAKYPVSMMVWFIRNKQFETLDSRFYQNRYDYGYSTKYISSSIPVTFFDGTTSNYVDVIDQVTMYFNGINVLTDFPDGVYHSVKQPMDHGLSIPTKNVYMYCFTDKPMSYDKNGAINFSLLDYKSTHLDISFLQQYNVQAQYTMNLYYYGYTRLTIADGRVSFST